MAGSSGETRTGDFEGSPLGRIAPGAVLRDRYRLDAELGRGGMGIVYLATDLALRREVAVKVVLETIASDRARHRLLREARSAATLNHPHIITVHDIGEEQGFPFFVMEVVEGPNLAQIAVSDVGEIVEIACQICDALEHAHAHGLVHRDLKPANVLLAGRPGARTVKIADLGLAVPIRGSGISETGTIVGTAAYMAPEQAMGEPVDGRADLYSLGVVLYELTTGRGPFSGDHPLAVISQHVNAPVMPPRAIRPDLPRAIEAVILKLLAKAPGQRYASARELWDALRQALHSRETPGTDEIGSVAVLDALTRGRLVGRADELAEAREFWRRAGQGRSHCLLLCGEPGVGKTRLGREIIVRAALEGGTVMTGACYEFEAATPYCRSPRRFDRGLATNRIRRRCRRSAGTSRRSWRVSRRSIEGRLGPFAERPTLAPHEERLLFFDAVTQAFRRIGTGRGLLFYVDDLHWADTSTLCCSGYLLRHLHDERVLLVASYREVKSIAATSCQRHG